MIHFTEASDDQAFDVESYDGRELWNKHEPTWCMHCASELLRWYGILTDGDEPLFHSTVSASCASSEVTIGDAVMPEFHHMLHAYTYKPRGPHCVASRGRSYGNWKLPFNLPPLILQTGGARVGCRRTSCHAWCIVMASWPQSGVVFSRLLYGIVGCLTSHYQESIWEAVYSTLFFEWLDEVSAKEWKWQLRIAALSKASSHLPATGKPLRSKGNQRPRRMFPACLRGWCPAIASKSR